MYYITSITSLMRCIVWYRYYFWINPCIYLFVCNISNVNCNGNAVNFPRIHNFIHRRSWKKKMKTNRKYSLCLRLPLNINFPLSWTYSKSIKQHVPDWSSSSWTKVYKNEFKFSFKLNSVWRTNILCSKNYQLQNLQSAFFHCLSFRYRQQWWLFWC